MKFIVAQVAPELCLTKKQFIDVIDIKISKIIEEKGQVDLIIFPETLGLWMCLMQPTSSFKNFMYKFLHSHQTNASKILSLISEDKRDNTDEIIVNLQFAKPENVNKLYSFDNKNKGLLDYIPAYSKLISNETNQTGRSKLANFIAVAADWLFSKINLRFIAQYLRSNEMLDVYKTAFSQAAQKYNIYIQAGSLFERVIGGTINAAYVFAPDGQIICRQEKWHPIPFEGMLGIKNGSGFQTFIVNKVKCGIAICADLNYPDNLVAELAKNGCKFIASPSGGIVPSHTWNFDYKNDVEYAQQARANECNVVIGRAYNAGDLLSGLLKFQGLSTIVKPGGLVEIVPKNKIISEYNLYYEI